jgi:hypothetical protein
VLPVKKRITELLESQSFHELSDINTSHHKLVNVLISLSYNKDTDLSWRAIEATGIVSKKIAESDTETVRNIVGRLLWMLRDESGGIGWSAPEMLGEIVRNNPELCADIAPIILSFHYEHMLTAGSLRATGRIGKIDDEMIAYAIPIVLSYLNSDDNNIRGHAVYALGELGANGMKDRLESLTGDNGKLLFYEEGFLKEVSVGELASRALTALEA